MLLVKLPLKRPAASTWSCWNTVSEPSCQAVWGSSPKYRSHRCAPLDRTFWAQPSRQHTPELTVTSEEPTDISTIFSFQSSLNGGAEINHSAEFCLNPWPTEPIITIQWLSYVSTFDMGGIWDWSLEMSCDWMFHKTVLTSFPSSWELPYFQTVTTYPSVRIWCGLSNREPQ